MNDSGILLINKDSGISSARALAQAKKQLQIKKAGHGGTLDPLASGLLVLLFGEATRYAGYVLDGDKHYLATIHFGYTSASDDAGEPLSKTALPPPPHKLRQRLSALLPDFCGTIWQRVPAYSALKHAGKPLYSYARRGAAAPVKIRQVHIASLTLQTIEADYATLSVHCGGGVYIRALARDLGAALGCGAYLHTLTRIACGKLRLEDAVSLSQLKAQSPDSCRRLMLPVETAAAALPAITLPEQAIYRLGGGQPLAMPPPDAVPPLRVLSPDGLFAGLIKYENGYYRPLNFLHWTRQAV